ncbi:MAG: zinc-ribbon domain-containing protein [Deltaproteobacteria bacterium]|jgi:predicted Zn finger-like uncharacterized protein|nr:zinc-ribbon domain-containing protein [Deltaproteobacteria bacterium]
MILLCPGCMTKLRVSDSSLTGKKEVWVKCPKCGERFRPQPGNLDKELGLAPAQTAPVPGQRDAVNSILNRIDYNRLGTGAREEAGTILDALPVLPEDPPRTKIWLGLTAVMVILLLGAMGWVFAYSVAPPVETQAYEAPPPLDYGKDILLSDFLALRRDLLRLRHVDRNINYKGRESRIYKYYVPLLAPDTCREITEIHLWSTRTTDGFKMSGTCADPRLEGATLEVRWDLRAAKIAVKDGPMELNLQLPASIS